VEPVRVASEELCYNGSRAYRQDEPRHFSYRVLSQSFISLDGTVRPLVSVPSRSE